MTEITIPNTVNAEDVAMAAGFVKDDDGCWTKPEVIEFNRRHGKAYKCAGCGYLWRAKTKAVFCGGCGSSLLGNKNAATECDYLSNILKTLKGLGNIEAYTVPSSDGKMVFFLVKKDGVKVEYEYALDDARPLPCSIGEKIDKQAAEIAKLRDDQNKRYESHPPEWIE